MDRPIEAIAYHGWGFDHTCWDDWLTRFATQGVSLQTFDRGYFGTERQPRFQHPHALKLVLTYSYGLHLCPGDVLQAADWLIILGGFIHFHPNQPGPERRSRRVLQRMIQTFASEPEQVLQEFRRTCYAPCPQDDRGGVGMAASIHQARLLEDLQRLNDAVFPLEQINPTTQVVVIHGQQDGIVSPQRGQELGERLHPRSRVICLEGAGHAACITHADACWAILSTVWDTRANGRSHLQ